MRKAVKKWFRGIKPRVSRRIPDVFKGILASPLWGRSVRCRPARRKVVRLFLQYCAWDVNELKVSILACPRKPVVYEYMHVLWTPTEEGSIKLGIGVQPFTVLSLHRDRRDIMHVVACPVYALPLDVDMMIPTGEEEFADAEGSWVKSSPRQISLYGRLSGISGTQYFQIRDVSVRSQGQSHQGHGRPNIITATTDNIGSLYILP